MLRYSNVPEGSPDFLGLHGGLNELLDGDASSIACIHVGGRRCLTKHSMLRVDSC